MPDPLPLDFVAYADAAVAVDASRHVDRDVRVRSIDTMDINSAMQVPLQAVLTQHPMELLFRPLRHGPWRIAPGQQLQQ